MIENVVESDMEGTHKLLTTYFDLNQFSHFLIS